jgi:addiction module HigA family antidote
MMNSTEPTHPGKFLKEEIEGMGYSANRLATALHVPTNRITGILNEQRSITADTALRLARFFGTDPEFWLNLQLSYDLQKTTLEKGKKISQEVEPRAA